MVIWKNIVFYVLFSAILQFELKLKEPILIKKWLVRDVLRFKFLLFGLFISDLVVFLTV